jgi:hypothetical protein
MEIRRRFARWKVNMPARIRLGGAEKFINCHIDDISMVGVKISLPLKLPDYKFIKLTILLSDTFALNVEAWVGWHRAGDGVNVYGLYFTRISDSDKEKIYRYLNANHREALEKAWWQGMDDDEKESEDLEDKRIFQRFTVKFPVRFLDASSGKEGLALSQDVSAKGIGITSKEELKPHSPIEIWLQIPDQGEPIYTRGEVIWSKALGGGEFRAGVNLEKADLMGLSRVLRA